jgi:MFS family permease
MTKSPDQSRDLQTNFTSHPHPLGPNYKWHVVAMLWCISFFNYADRQAVFSVLSLIQTEMRLTNVDLGWLGSSFAWVYGLCAPFAGAVVDRVRRKTAILAGLQAWSVICMATALSRRFSHLLFFRAAEGLGETFYYPASVSLLSDYHGKATRSRALGLHQTSVYVGALGGGYFAGLIGQHYGWRSSFVVFGVLGVLLGLFLNRFLVEPRRGAAEGEPDPKGPQLPSTKLPLREVLRLIGTTPTVLLLMMAFLCANFVAMVLLAWMPKYVGDAFHFDLATSALIANSAQVASMVGSPLGGWLADRSRQRRAGGRILVQAAGVLGAAPFVVLCGQTQSAGWLVAGLMAWGLFKGIYDANIFAAAFDVVPPEARGTTAGFLNLVGWLGGGSAPVVIGWLADNQGLGTAISYAATVYVAACFLLLIGAFLFIKRDLGRLQMKFHFGP